MKNFIIDRFEGSWAVIEILGDPSLAFNLPKKLLPQNAKEGDVLNINLAIDKEGTLKRKESIQNKLDSLKKQDKGDNVTL